METLEAGMAKSFITKLFKEENVAALRSGEKTLEDLAVHVSPRFVSMLVSSLA